MTVYSKSQWIRDNLKPHEHWAGIIVGKNATQDYHLILLPDECIRPSWSMAMTWSFKTKDALLPNRREQALLWANLREHFQPVLHWSSESYGGDDNAAWCQSFYDGEQLVMDKHVGCRARAIKRIYIENTNSTEDEREIATRIKLPPMPELHGEDRP
jgi:hypothetical protein